MIPLSTRKLRPGAEIPKVPISWMLAGRFKSKAAPFSPTPGFREAATVAIDVIPTVDHHDEEANV